MRQLVWFSPCPGIGLKAVLIKRRWGFYTILYRDFDGKVRSMSTWGSNTLGWGLDQFYERDRKLGY